MGVTETQAQKKLCPKKAAMEIGAHQKTCLGSDCMAWRWADNGLQWSSADKKMVSAEGSRFRLGFCGMAGAPLDLKVARGMQ